MSAYGIYGKNPLEFLDFPQNSQDLRENNGETTSKFVEPLEIHFPHEKKHVELDLGLVRSFRIKPVGDKSEVLDLLAFTSDTFLLSLKNQTKPGTVRLLMVDFHGNVKSDNEEEFVKRMSAMEAERTMAITDGQKVVITTRKPDGNWSSFAEDFKIQSAVQAIASVNHSTLAVAIDKGVTLLTSEGIVSDTYDRRCGSNCLGTWTYPVVDMCCLTDDKLLLFDQCGIHQINPYNGKSHVFEVPKLKDITSVAAYDDNFLFACDANDKLLLFGLDSKTVVKVWSLREFLKLNDTLQHISVFGKNTCVCSTKFGWVYVFTITLKDSSA